MYRKNFKTIAPSRDTLKYRMPYHRDTDFAFKLRPLPHEIEASCLGAPPPRDKKKKKPRSRSSTHVPKLVVNSMSTAALTRLGYNQLPAFMKEYPMHPQVIEAATEFHKIPTAKKRSIFATCPHIFGFDDDKSTEIDVRPAAIKRTCQILGQKYRRTDDDLKRVLDNRHSCCYMLKRALEPRKLPPMMALRRARPKDYALWIKSAPVSGAKRSSKAYPTLEMTPTVVKVRPEVAFRFTTDPRRMTALKHPVLEHARRTIIERSSVLMEQDQVPVLFQRRESPSKSMTAIQIEETQPEP